jgi:hypothetical protein
MVDRPFLGDESVSAYDTHLLVRRMFSFSGAPPLHAWKGGVGNGQPEF